MHMKFAFFPLCRTYFEIDDINNEIRENSLKWSIQRGSRSGRVAWQYIVDVAGKLEKKISF